jgi:hypothetical protein
MHLALGTFFQSLSLSRSLASRTVDIEVGEQGRRRAWLVEVEGGAIVDGVLRNEVVAFVFPGIC